MYIATCGCAFANLTTKCDIKNKLPNKYFLTDFVSFQANEWVEHEKKDACHFG